jgi:DNA repair ATPase RecN
VQSIRFASDLKKILDNYKFLEEHQDIEYYIEHSSYSSINQVYCEMEELYEQAETTRDFLYENRDFNRHTLYKMLPAYNTINDCLEKIEKLQDIIEPIYKYFHAEWIKIYRKFNRFNKKIKKQIMKIDEDFKILSQKKEQEIIQFQEKVKTIIQKIEKTNDEITEIRKEKKNYILIKEDNESDSESNYSEFYRDELTKFRWKFANMKRWLKCYLH